MAGKKRVERRTLNRAARDLGDSHAKKPRQAETGGGGGDSGRDGIPRELSRAFAAFHDGRPRKAIKLIDEYLAANEDDSRAHYLKMKCLKRIGRRGEALEALSKYLSLKAVTTAEAVIADFLMEDGLHSEAEAILRARLEREPDQSTTLFTLGRLLLFQGRILEALEIHERLEEAGGTTPGSGRDRPPLVRADYLIALIYATLGDKDSLDLLYTRLKAGGVTPRRLAFFDALRRLIAKGDLDRFARDMASLSSEVSSHPFYGPLFRSVTPEIFLPGGMRRAEVRKVLGSKIRGVKIDGADLSSDDAAIVSDLFEGAESVRLESLKDGADGGRSGDAVFRAFPKYPRLVEISSLVKLGPKHRIMIEKEKVERYAEGRLHTRHFAHILGFAATLRRAGVRAIWAVDDEEEVLSLRRLLVETAAVPSEAPAIISPVMDSLISRALAGWYNRNAKKRRIAPAVIFDGIDGLIKGLPIPSAEDSARKIGRVLERRGKRPVTVLWGLRHGDLNARNVLLDRSHRICLIDFYKSGPGPILRDLARLEVDIRYETFPMDPSYAEEVKWMDSILVKAPSLGSELDCDYRLSMAARFRSVTSIRKAASNLAPSESMGVYLLHILLELSKVVSRGHLDPAMLDLAEGELHSIIDTLSTGMKE